MKVSSHCIALIQKFEGLSTKAYKAAPSEKYYTIGYGHYGADVKATDVITADGAMNILNADVDKFSSAVSGYLDNCGVKLNQNQFDALVCFAFNVGVTALINSTLWKCLIAGDHKAAANQFLRWNISGGAVSKGLTRRREAERLLFLS